MTEFYVKKYLRARGALDLALLWSRLDGATRRKGGEMQLSLRVVRHAFFWVFCKDVKEGPCFKAGGEVLQYFASLMSIVKVILPVTLCVLHNVVRTSLLRCKGESCEISLPACS